MPAIPLKYKVSKRDFIFNFFFRNSYWKVVLFCFFFNKGIIKNKTIFLRYQSWQRDLKHGFTTEPAPPSTNRQERYRNSVVRPKITDLERQQWVPLQNNHKTLTSQCLSPTSFTVTWGTSANLFHFIDILPLGAGELLPTSTSPSRRPRGASTAGRGGQQSERSWAKEGGRDDCC